MQVVYLSDERTNWINERMKKLLLSDLGYSRANTALEAHFCPSCKKHKDIHDDVKCSMRFEEKTQDVFVDWVNVKGKK